MFLSWWNSWSLFHWSAQVSDPRNLCHDIFYLVGNMFGKSPKLTLLSPSPPACCLHCTTCRKTADWEECVAKNKSVECTIEEVNNFHHYMSQDNRGVPAFVKETEENVTFSCYTIESTNHNAWNGVRKPILSAGCTLETVDICDGWPWYIEITRCGMCNTTGLCSGGDRSSIEGLVMGVSVFVAVIVLGRLL